MRAVILTLICAVLPFGPALAAPQSWQVDPASSTLGVFYTINGKLTEGSFADFSGTATFDPDAMEDATLDFVVQTDSVDVGDPFGTTFVKSVDWFDVERFPEGTYILTDLTRVEGNSYRAVGDLTLRGVTRTIESDMHVTVADGQARAQGEFGFDRKEFNIGVGFSTLFVEIAPDVRVIIDLVALPLN